MIGQVLAAPGAVAALIQAARDATDDIESGPQDAAASSGTPSGRNGSDLLVPTRFDRFMDGMNRLPRPLLAFGTLALFGYAMYDPARFAERMTGLKEVPEPLWWLLGGVVGFYFGAREAHYFRTRPAAPKPALAEAPAVDPNPALDAWRAGQPD